MEILENENLRITIRETGAEIISIIVKKTGREILHNTKDSPWKYQCPILFPFVGNVVDHQYFYGEKLYKTDMHGFLMHKEFVCERISTTQLRYSFVSKNLDEYPFCCKIVFDYSLHEDNIKIVRYVENLDEKTMYFGIGEHFTFSCNLEQSSVTIDGNAKAYRRYIDFERRVLNKQREQTDKLHKIQLSQEMFQKLAVVYEDLGVRTAVLDVDHQYKVVLSLSRVPRYFSLWCFAENSNYVCLEPWYTSPDEIDSSQNLVEKKNLIQLLPREQYSYEIEMRIQV